MKESGLTPPRMPKEWETARKSGFQTESQQPSPSMQSHKASTMSVGGGAAPPGCRLGSRTTGDRAHCLAGPSRQRKTKAGQESSTICSELAPAGRERGGSWWRRGALGRPAAACGCGEAPREEGELWSTRLQPAGAGRLWTGRPGGVRGAHRGCVLRFLWLVLLETAKVREAVRWVHRALAAVGPIVTGAWLPGPGLQRLTAGGPVSWAAQQAEVPSLSAQSRQPSRVPP